MALSDTKYTFIGVPNGYQRDLPFALDRSSIFYSLAEAEIYASGVADKDTRGISGATSYVGQVLAVYTVDASDNITAVTIYKIDVDRKLKSLETIEITVDNASIVNTDGTLQLAGFATALDGAQPQVKLTYVQAAEGESADENGNKLDETGNKIVSKRELVWIVPSTDTVDGMQKTIATLQDDVDKLETVVGDENDGLVKDVADLESGKADKTALAGVAHDITYSDLTITIPMKAADGVSDAEPLVINLPKDNFIRSGSYDTETQEIVLVVDDDTTDEATKEVRIPASALIDVYTGDANTAKKAITVKVSADNVVSAELEIDADSILKFTEDGKLTVDTEALNTAVDSKLDKTSVKTTIDTTEGTTYKDTDVPSVEAVKIHVATELEKVNTAHNKLIQEHTHNGTDSAKISYKNLTDTPTKLSEFTDDITAPITAEVNKKQDQVVSMEKTLELASWTETEVNGGTVYTYELDISYSLDGEDASLPENCMVDIAPQTASDSDKVLEAHISSAVEASETSGSIIITAKKQPTDNINVVVKITPSIKVIA